MRRWLSVAVMLAGAVAATAILPGGSPAAPGTPTVTVTMRDFSFRLSRTALPAGKVRFVFRNAGAVRHDFAVVGRPAARSRILGPKGSQTRVLTLPKGVLRFVCTLPGHDKLGMTGTLRVGGATAAPKQPRTEPRPEPSSRLALTPIASDLGSPATFVVSPPGDRSRLMIVLQNGVVRLVKDGVLQGRPFLDLSPSVGAQGEQGLLSLAFAPDYAASGRFYAYFNNRSGNIRIAELFRSEESPDVAGPQRRRVLALTKFAANHNGGMMQFGPDGLLYVAIGDGGSAPPDIPVGSRGQSLADLFGTIIRIDPAGALPYGVPLGNPFVTREDALSEIVAFGLRNPWRFDIDPKTGTMLIGDVGEGSREEVDLLHLDRLGVNFGWPCREGTTVPRLVRPESCARAVLTPPLYEYAHAGDRCSITGGVTMRDPRLPALDGRYVFADFCEGELRAIDPSARPVRETDLRLRVAQPTSFGADSLGRVYVTSGLGAVFRIDPAD